MSHLPTPWSFAPDIEDGPSMDWNIFDANGILVCVTSEEDARRIVACVNACAGIPTDMLEAMPSGPASLLPMYARLEQQRNELLAALKSLNYSASADSHNAQVVRAAIAKAEAK